MKTIICTMPMRPSEELKYVQYPVDENKAIEYEKPVLFPINGILAKKINKSESVKIIFIMTKSANSECEKNKVLFIKELEEINTKINANLSFDTVYMEYKATKQIYNKLLTDLTEKISPQAEIYADITFGSKPEILSLFCAFRFIDEFKDAIIQYIVYGKVEFNKKTKGVENPMIYDLTSLYHLFKILGMMNTVDINMGSKLLKNFFAL